MRLGYIILISSLSLFNLFFSSCSGSKEKLPDKILEASYSYILSDSSDNRISEGILTVETAKLQKISGKFEINKNYVSNIKPLNKKNGKFEGNVDENIQSMSINMNPKLADSNIFVNAKVKGDSLIGDWNFSTNMGMQQNGRFRAVLISE